MNQNRIGESLIEFINTLIIGRRILLIAFIGSFVLGIILNFVLPKEYTANTTMIPQMSGGNEKIGGGGLSGLASIAGINLGSLGGSSTIAPTLYPKVMQSIPFQKKLMNSKLSVPIEEFQSISFKEYYTEVYDPGLIGFLKKYTIGLPGTIMEIFRAEEDSNRIVKDSLITISKVEKELIDRLNSQVNLEVNEEYVYLTLSVKMPNAKIAAALALKTQVLLQEEVIKIKIQKAKDQLDFMKERFDIKKDEFEAIQLKLAEFLDRNKNVHTEKARIELQKLQYEFDLANSIYSDLATQIESQEIQVKETTPVFTIINPVVVPFERSAPRSMIILFVCMVGGIGFGVIYIFSKQLFDIIKADLNNRT